MPINKEIKKEEIKDMRLGELVEAMMAIRDYQYRINPLAKISSSAYAKKYSEIKKEINKREKLYKK